MFSTCFSLTTCNQITPCLASMVASGSSSAPFPGWEGRTHSLALPTSLWAPSASSWGWSYSSSTTNTTPATTAQIFPTSPIPRHVVLPLHAWLGCPLSCSVNTQVSRCLCSCRDSSVWSVFKSYVDVQPLEANEAGVCAFSFMSPAENVCLFKLSFIYLSNNIEVSVYFSSNLQMA